MIPPLGTSVLYRTDGRNGLVYDLPAIVTCTAESHPGDYPDGRANPLPVPEGDHVHLTVFTPGGFGTTVAGAQPSSDEDFVGATRIQPGSGSYVEWSVSVQRLTQRRPGCHCPSDVEVPRVVMS